MQFLYGSNLISSAEEELRGQFDPIISLRSTNLGNVYLEGANLAGADLEGVNQVGAHLTTATLSYANLAGADQKLPT